jgi:hypothetical protein
MLTVIACLRQSVAELSYNPEMSKTTRIFLSSLFCACTMLLGYAQDPATGDNLQGRLVGGDVYINPALGMTITLPGTWEQGRATPKQSQPPSDCSGALCGNPEINVALRAKADSALVAQVRLAGYKLSAQYLDRSRHPLSEFADIMLEGSMRSSSDLVPIGGRSAIKLDGKTAFRQAAGMQGETKPKIIGYVSEANGYVFMLVLSVRDSSPQALQAAIEAMKVGAMPH